MSSGDEASRNGLKLASRVLLWVGVFALLLFVPAGTLAWPGAWVFLAILTITSLASTLWLARHDPALLKERLRPPFQREQPFSDKALMATFMPIWLGWYVVMGLDRRFGWSHVPAFLQVLGALMFLAAMWLVWLTLKENSFAATAVKLQTERGHKVISTGPYAYVRHPQYVGFILVMLGFLLQWPTLLTLASPLPGQFVPIATGDAGAEGSYTIAGYGTAREAERMHSAGLKEARLIADSRYGGLVDPNRRGPISASACMGDSGGPVAKFDGKRYVLVGIVERVSNYAGIGACGFLTHFSSVSGTSTYAAAPEGTTRQVSEPRHHRAASKGKRSRWAAR